MKTCNMLKHITFLLLIFAFTQCTVQKRLYNKGYTISWNHKFQKDKPEKVDQVAEATESENWSSDLDTVATHNDAIQADVLADDPVAAPEVGPILENPVSKPEFADTVYIVSKNVPEGVASACLLAGSMIGTRLAVLLPASYVGLGLLTCGVMFFASFALAIISMIVFANHRKDYLTNVLGKLTFILDLIILALFVAIVVLLILTF